MKLLVPILAVLLLTASCTSGSEGIFASIEREQKIVSLGGLSTTATVTSMAEVNGKYYITGGKALFSKSTSDSVTKWSKSTVGGGAAVAAVASTGGGTDLWAVANGKLYHSTDGDSWDAPVALDGSDTAYDLVPIRDSDGEGTTEALLVADNGGAKNKVYKLNGATRESQVTLSAAALYAPVTAAVKVNGTSYALMSENFVWTWDGSATSLTASTVSSGPTSGYGGLLYTSSNTTYYLGTISNAGTGGSVYTTSSLTSPITWNEVSAVPSKGLKVGSNIVTVGALLYNATNSTIWLATGASVTQEGTGYLELSTNGSSVFGTTGTPKTDSNNYNSSALPTAAIGTLFKGSTGYFIGTVAHGLWFWKGSGAGTSRTWGQQ